MILKQIILEINGEDNYQVYINPEVIDTPKDPSGDIATTIIGICMFMGWEPVIRVYEYWGGCPEVVSIRDLAKRYGIVFTPEEQELVP